MSGFDPRYAVIGKRFAKVAKVRAVTGGKGGIGKSLVASTHALNLARSGMRVGLLDLDFTGPCDHLVLGMKTGFPTEEFGIDPSLQHGIHFLSITHFVGEDPAPLRGEDFSSAMLELLAITRWGELDVLVVDMPPGIGDATLDAVRLLPEPEFLVVSTPNLLVRETVRRTLRFLKELDVRFAGLVGNMVEGDGAAIEELAQSEGVPWLGALPRDLELEAAMGDPERLAQTEFARALAALELG
jgi:ATP-binding protein involved in chromosome partitioning